MWVISGRFKGVQYTVTGTATSADIPDWLMGALRREVADTGGVLELTPPGPRIVVADDASAMSAVDVVMVLEVLTSVERVSGELPPRTAHPVWTDSQVVY